MGKPIFLKTNSCYVFLHFRILFVFKKMGKPNFFENKQVFFFLLLGFCLFLKNFENKQNPKMQENVTVWKRCHSPEM